MVGRDKGIEGAADDRRLQPNGGVFVVTVLWHLRSAKF